MKRGYYLCFFIFLNSCGTIKDSSVSELIESSKSNQQNEYLYTSEDLPSSSIIDSFKNSSISKQITLNSLHIANTIGLIGYLEEYNNLKSIPIQNLSLEQRIQLLEIKQEMDHQINISSLIISVVTSELDFEEERISQIANYLSEKQSNLESKLTIGAIVLGATGAILTGGIIKNDNVSNAVGISTGVGEAVIGLTMLFNERKIKFVHQRNILKDIWEGPETSRIFPSFIWYYLNYESEQQSSLRKEIISKWTQFGQIDEDTSELTDLYFGNGGVYTSDQLNNRADMHDQLESQIYLLKQKLMTLANEIDNL